MADTQRTEAAILALLADNSTGDISPQDMRDAIVSMKKMMFNLEMMLGANSELSIGHDGTDGKIDTSLVAPSDLHIDTGTAKTLVLDQPVYDDLPPMPIVNTQLGGSAPSLDTFIGDIKQYTFGVGNFVFGASELTHKYKEGTDLDIHVHWTNNGVDGSDRGVKWQVTYSVSNADGVAPFASAFPAQIVVSAETTVPALTPDRSHILGDLGTISGAGLKIGAYIVWKLERIAAAGTDPSGDPYALAQGFHAQMDTTGSRQEYVK